MKIVLTIILSLPIAVIAQPKTNTARIEVLEKKATAATAAITKMEKRAAKDSVTIAKLTVDNLKLSAQIIALQRLEYIFDSSFQVIPLDTERTKFKISQTKN